MSLLLTITGTRWLAVSLPLLLALAIGAALRVELVRTAPPFLVANDSADYLNAAVRFVDTGELQLSVKRTPLYSIFLAGLVGAVGPSLDRLVAAQHLFGLLTIPLTYLLGRLAFGPLAGALAAFGVAINGSLLTMEHLLVSEVLATPLLLAGLVALLVALRQEHAAFWLLAGLLLGLGALSRPLGIAVLGVVVVALPACRLPLPTFIRAVALLSLGAALCLVPWAARQYLVHEQAFVNGGLGDALFSRVHRYDPTFTLRAGDPSGAGADWAIRARIVELASQFDYPREIRATLTAEFGIDDRKSDRLLREVALATIAHDPGRYVLGTLSMAGRLTRGTSPRLLDLWSSIERDRVLQGWPPGLTWMLVTDRPIHHVRALDRAAMLLALYRDDLPSGMVPLILAPLGAAWALAAGRRTGAGVIPLVIATQIVLYVALDGPLYRYRFPLQPLITLLGAAGLALLLQHFREIWREVRSAAMSTSGHKAAAGAR